MIGEVIKFKFPYESEILQDAYDCIQLQEPHEAGEIINDEWFIVNCSFGGFQGIYSTNEYVKVVNLRYIDVFKTDIDYSTRNDLIKINTNIEYYTENNIQNTISVYVYSIK